MTTDSYSIVRDTIGQICVDTLPALLPGVKVWQTVPKSDALAVPAVVVAPAKPTITYHETASDLAGWRFELWLLLGNINEHAAQLRAAEIVAPQSALIRALDCVEVPDGWIALIDADVGQQKPWFSNAVYEGAKLNIAGNA